MKNFPNIRAAIYGEPWMITETGLQTIVAIAENAMPGGEIDAQFAGAQSKPIQKVSDRYQVTNGIAVIPIFGSLIPHANLFSKISGATSYDDINEMFYDAMSRLDVEKVCLSIDSPGGAVTGCFECAANILAGSQEKQTIAAIGGKGASAAYLLASQCNIVVASESSMVGSIGVVMGLADTTRAEKNQGNDSMVFRSKELKAPGNGPMTPNQIQSIQRLMMQLDGKFEDAVKAARPIIKKEAFTGESFLGMNQRDNHDAISYGLIDDIMSIDEVLEFYGSRILS